MHVQVSTNQKPPLWQHQSDTINLLKNEERVYDGSDPGTGKTRAALEAIDYRGSKAVLIIAPKTLVESAWAEDISQWTPGLSYSISLAANRSEGFSHDADIYITNTDATKWLAKQSKTFFEAFDSLIIDEFKNKGFVKIMLVLQIKLWITIFQFLF